MPPVRTGKQRRTWQRWHQRLLSSRLLPFSFFSERICWWKSEEGEEGRARFLGRVLWTCLRKMIVLSKFAACAQTTTTHILRPVSDLSSNTALALFNSPSQPSADPNAERDFVPSVRCWRSCDRGRKILLSSPESCCRAEIRTTGSSPERVYTWSRCRWH